MREKHRFGIHNTDRNPFVSVYGCKYERGRHRTSDKYVSRYIERARIRAHSPSVEDIYVVTVVRSPAENTIVFKTEQNQIRRKESDTAPDKDGIRYRIQ